MFSRFCILFLFLLANKVLSQNTLNWNLNVPAVENAEKVHLEIVDSGENTIFSDSIPLSGSRSDIPTPVVRVGASRENVSLRSEGQNVHVNVNSNSSQDAYVRIFSVDGKEVFSAKERINPGENSFSFSPGNLAAGVYIVNYSSPILKKSLKIVSGFGGLSGGTIDEKVSSFGSLKSASSWKYIISHPKLLTDTILVPYSPVMTLEGNLLSRPTVLLNAIDVFSRKGEYGEARTLEEMTGLAGMYVAVNNIVFGKTGANGKFTGRPDFIGDVRLCVVDSLENFYSKWYDVNLKSGSLTEVKDFKAEAVFMVENYVDNLGKRLVEALWDIGAYKNNAHTNFIKGQFEDNTKLEKKVHIRKEYFDGKHNHSLADIRKQIENFHVPGLPKLVEGDSLNSYIYIHYGGTQADGQTRWTYRQNEEGLYYKTRADIYINTLWADYTGPQNPLYALLEHELDRVYFAYLEFPEKQYVMYTDPINRVFRDGYSPENSPLEDKILMLVANGPTHLQLHNNFLLTYNLNLEGYNGTKSADISGLRTSKDFEKMFPGAVLESGIDKSGKFITVTSKN